IEKYLQPSEAENYRAGKTIDGWKAISQNSRLSAADLSVSGRTNATNYFLSGSVTSDKGLIYNDNQTRYSVRANLENKIATWLTLGLNANFIQRNLSGKEADILGAFQTSPYGKLYYDDGEPTRYPVPEEQLVGNPMRMALLTKNEEIWNNLFTNIYAVINLPQVNGLSYRLNYAPNYRWRHNYNFVRQDKYVNANTTSASKYNQENFDWVLENILTYKKRISTNHAFDLTLLYGLNHTQSESTTANAAPLSNATLGWNGLGLGDVQTVLSDAAQTDGVSAMARLNYQFLNKYLFTFTVRRDGSSVFAANNKYANFPSAAVAWIMSDEKFLKPLAFINSLKLRASYGSVGNQAIAPYQSLSLSGTTQYVFGDGGSTVTGAFPNTIANPNLKWETTTTTNLALDFELFNNRISGTVEAYRMDTKDLIVRRSLPIMTGFTSILTNLGATSNKGIEVSLNTVNLRSKKFEWTSNFVFSSNQNKIVHLYNADLNGDGIEDDDLSNRWFIGKPVFVAFDYVQDGVYQEGDVLPNGYKAGFIRLKDLNNDKKIDAADRTIIGQLEPKYRWGITNNFKYGNITLSFFVNAMEGWIKSFNQLDFTGSVLGNNYPGRAVNMLDADWWTAGNKSNTRPSLVYTNPYVHGYYLSRNFVRLQDLSLAYEVPKKWTDKARLKSLRVYASGRNLYTITDWIGPDPESGYNSQAEYFPTPRTVIVGLNIGF
ncbi:MAG TPA: SusC/RagA family TonB-linked outer membrane protein, partial [Chitinophagaceae bacterium]|nr:SusC/RagA family TonB-linked outer membrane protein [Chitinophagaceae bacterium]